MRKKINELIIFLHTKPRRWTEILDRFSISKATLSRYMKRLLNEKIVRKMLNEEGKIVYSVNTENITNVLEASFLEKNILEINRAIEDIQKLKHLGAFSNGLSEEDISKFMEKHESLNLENLIDFTFLLKNTMRDSNPKVRIRFRLDVDTEKCLSELKTRLNHMKELRKRV